MRPARAADRAGPELLYVSAAPYYDAYVGSAARARRLLRAIWPKPRHTASHEVCHVAEAEGVVAGVLAAFAAADGDRLARRFLLLSIARLPAWRWPPVVRHLRACAAVTPMPPAGALYVDALAVDESRRRRGVARALLDEAERLARERGLPGVALDTGLDNTRAQALYERHGYARGAVHPVVDARVAELVGGPGFVSYFKAL